ncbi:glycosyltransferase involved in cell wall biosynthesis [Paucimonas lemoignei]|uniref:Glycosyltransferase involved in cell wall biosynthesis n=1 Tax=Paucimonas lemoignei TaxID=29443 RepID=A0A4R3HR28_PAULE|nr:glycosyltransferase family 2 protein [Paucimonas lemoignei]TCS35556.1 glycosyltransferase involved in cell wall biosynthesis [Paucimonas lemoignei]
MFKPCVVIPVYNHEHAIGAVTQAVLATGLPCVLVDDGSTPQCAQVLDDIAKASPQQIMLVRHAHNQGKGGAVLTGIRHAADAGYTHALQIDADGQHNVADIPRFIEQAAAHPASVIVGYPQYDESVPAVRLYGRYLTHVWVWINTLSLQIKDSMCGFRVYPVAPVLELTKRHRIGSRMDFDTDILVRLSWEGVDMVNVGTRVGYPTDGVSHFRMVLDNVLISRMHATLFFGMLLRAPKLLARKWSRA